MLEVLPISWYSDVDKFTMQNILIISAIMACATAAPAYLLAEQTHVLHAVPLTKSTITKSSQVVDHGSTFVHAPVYPVVHGSAKTTVTKSSQVVNHGGATLVHPVHAVVNVMPVHEVYHVPSKTTVTKTNHVVSHGGTTLFHSPVVSVVHTPAVHTPVVVHSAPVVALKAGSSAVSHHSSTVHETVPVFSSFVGVHH